MAFRFDQTSMTKLNKARRMDTVLELRAKGYSYRDIQRETGISRASANQYVQKSLQELAEKRLHSANVIRLIEQERVNIVIKTLWPMITEDKSLEAMNTLHKFMQLEMQLNGVIDQPIINNNSVVQLVWPDMPDAYVTTAPQNETPMLITMGGHEDDANQPAETP